MKTNEIFKLLEEAGGLDIEFCKQAAREDNVSLKKYVVEYVKNNYDCSDYVAKKVAEIYL